MGRGQPGQWKQNKGNNKRKKERKKNKKQLSLFVKRDERSGGSFTFHLYAYIRWDKKQETTNGAKAPPHRSLTAPEGTKKERIKLS